MPGSSLWLIPPSSHPLHAILAQLITKTIPTRFPDHAGPPFEPHITLTSSVDPSAYGDDPQTWLDAIPWPPGNDVKVRFLELKSQDVFFRRCYISVAYDDCVRNLAGLARARGVNGEEGPDGKKTNAWLEEWIREFGPHLSLVYDDTPIGEKRLREITGLVQDACVCLEDESGNKPEALGSWEGGTVWLVPTDRSIADWRPIASRVL